MRIRRAVICLALCAAMLLPMSACGGGGGFRIIDEYSGEGNYYLAFRKGDRLREYVSAAMEELAATSTLRTTSISWFGENLVSVKGRQGAMEDLWESKPDRTVIVGIDLSNMPLSFFTGGVYQGFDVDMIGYICGYLGWNMVFYPIEMANAEVELNAGNIDIAMAVPEDLITSSLDTSPAYLTSQYVLVTRSGSHIRSRSGMKGKILGVSVADEEVLYKGKKSEKFVSSLGSIIYQTNTEGLFQALMKGEVDGILVSSVVAAYYMK